MNAAERALFQAAEDQNYDDEFEEDNHASSSSSSSDGKTSALALLQQSAKEIQIEERQVALEQLNIEVARHEPRPPKSGRPTRTSSGNDVSSILQASADEVFSTDKQAIDDAVVAAVAVAEDDDDDEDDVVMVTEGSPEAELLFACHKGILRQVEDLIDNRHANIRVIDRHGWTPIHWAASKGYTKICAFLLNQCDTSTADNAAKSNRLKYINKKDRLSGFTPLHVACIGGHVECVTYLLESGACCDRMNIVRESSMDVLPNNDNGRVLMKIMLTYTKRKVNKKLVKSHTNDISSEGKHNDEVDDRRSDYKSDFKS